MFRITFPDGVGDFTIYTAQSKPPKLLENDLVALECVLCGGFVLTSFLDIEPKHRKGLCTKPETINEFIDKLQARANNLNTE